MDNVECSECNDRGKMLSPELLLYAAATCMDKKASDCGSDYQFAHGYFQALQDIFGRTTAMSNLSGYKEFKKAGIILAGAATRRIWPNG